MTPEEIITPAISALTDEEQIRGSCPFCNGVVRSRLYYVNGRGYVCFWECDNASPQAPDDPVCDYRRVL